MLSFIEDHSSRRTMSDGAEAGESITVLSYAAVEQDTRKLHAGVSCPSQVQGHSRLALTPQSCLWWVICQQLQGVAWMQSGRSAGMFSVPVAPFATADVDLAAAADSRQ